tara:strand:- start:1013 stop:1690 length:678 start_codon:yes stop_codon:yes gene_type:complete
MMHFYLNEKSKNKKTGEMPVSTSDRGTCPDACPFKNNGCYAEGYPLKGRWDEVTSGKRGGLFSDFVNQVAALPDNILWRHNQSGDLPGDGENVDRGALLALAGANTGKRGFTFSHYNVESNKHNRAAIATANARGFTINLSANNLNHADKLTDLGIGPVATVLPHDFDARKTTTPQGRIVAQCPATYRDDVTCKTCGLCQKQSRKVIVGFPAHGNSKRKASAVAA